MVIVVNPNLINLDIHTHTVYSRHMEKCVYRIETKIQGVSKAFNKAMGPLDLEACVSGNLRQKFGNGLCQILTANDIGPMECRQPNCNEKNCPDIAHLRK